MSNCWLYMGLKKAVISFFKNKKNVKKEEALIKIINLLPGHVYWYGLDGIIYGTNEQQARALGFASSKEAIGKNTFDILKGANAEVLKKNNLWVVKNKEILTKEEVITYPDGRTENVLSTKAPWLDDSGNPIGVIGVSINISKQKELEMELGEAKDNAYEVLYNIIDMLPGYIFWQDRNGVYLGANDQEAKLAGLISKYDMIGKTNFDMPWKDRADDLHKINADVMSTGKEHVVEEVGTLVGGKEAVFLSRKAPLRSKKGETTGIIGISFDITNQKEAERLKLENEAHKIQLEEQDKFTKITEQVAHDIRSPVASLLMLVKSCPDIPEIERIALREAAGTISDIANNLLSKYKNKDSDFGIEKQQKTLVSTLLLQLLTDKKYQYKDFPVKFDYEFSQAGNFAFIKIDATSLKRAISNIVNNAVDALEGRDGKILIRLDANTESVYIRIEDNGKGMSQELINKIKNNIAVTEGKKEGHGIGLSQVRETLQQNHGELSIESEINKGSRVVLTFPRVKAPSWIAEEILLNPHDVIVILDDDRSIHAAWNSHFDEILKNESSITLQHFEIGKKALEYLNGLNVNEKNKIFLLTDFELLKQELNGLHIIELSKIRRSILVTSHYANTTVRELAAKIGTKILPKQLASEIPIQINSIMTGKASLDGDVLKKVDLVIVDDDENFVSILVNFTFEDLAVDYYSNPESFLQNIEKYSKDIKVCLDKNFGDGHMDGFKLASILHQKGFKRLFIISGEFFSPGKLPDYLVVVDKTEVEKIRHL